MKKYDFSKAKRLIQLKADQISDACLGMKEDWFWTAETVFNHGRFTVDLEIEGLCIAGVDCSQWATPALLLAYKDGREEIVNCYESDGEPSGQRPEWLQAGCLSGPNQAYIDSLSKPKLALAYSRDESQGEQR